MSHTEDLIRKLVHVTGLSASGVRKILKEKRAPRHPLVAKRWAKVMGEAK